VEKTHLYAFSFFSLVSSPPSEQSGEPAVPEGLAPSPPSEQSGEPECVEPVASVEVGREELKAPQEWRKKAGGVGLDICWHNGLFACTCNK